MQELCERELPQFELRVSDAQLALRPWLEPPERLPASSGEATAPLELAPQDRRAWQGWAEDWLVRIQNLTDVATGELGYGRARDEMTTVANLLVTFHGYAQTGRVERMNETLSRISQTAARARTEQCGPRS
jgi:hypothetical protein